jgi:hypothetical protein
MPFTIYGNEDGAFMGIDSFMFFSIYGLPSGKLA